MTRTLCLPYSSWLRMEVCNHCIIICWLRLKRKSFEPILFVSWHVHRVYHILRDCEWSPVVTIFSILTICRLKWRKLWTNTIVIITRISCSPYFFVTALEVHVRTLENYFLEHFKSVLIAHTRGDNRINLIPILKSGRITSLGLSHSERNLDSNILLV